MLRLYTYFRSSAAYRVRIALNLKGLAYEALSVHLVRDGGQQNHAAYRALSPLGTVPTLETDSCTFTQSLAIIEYLDEIHPLPPLLPESGAGQGAGADRRLRYPSRQQPARPAIPWQAFRGDPGAEGRLVSPLGKRGPARRRAVACRQSGHRRLLPRRSTDAGRLLPGAAGLQCALLRLSARRNADHPPYHRRLRVAAGFLQRRSGHAAGR